MSGLDFSYHQSAGRDMLRVGLMLDSFMSSAWISKVVVEIQSSDCARVEVVLVDCRSAPGRLPLRARVGNLWNYGLFHLYERWDYRRNRVRADALAMKDLSPLLAGVPSISLRDSRDGGAAGVAMAEDQLSDLRGRRLDVLLHVGSGECAAGLDNVAHYGCWSFHFGASRTKDRRATLFPELFERNPVAESTLQIRNGLFGSGRILYRSYASTDLKSLYSTRNAVYWKTAEFAVRSLRDLHLRGVKYVQGTFVGGEHGPEQSCEDWVPDTRRMIAFMGRYCAGWAQARLLRWRPGSRTKWYLAVRKNATTSRFDDPSGYRLMMSPKDRFYADPFLVEWNGRTFLFFEDFRYATGRALISCCELAPDGVPGASFEVLNRPYHLSYPFVFQHEGEMYMLPETKENRQVELYRATNFPTTWISQAVLLSDIHAVDATISQIDGRFWMFANVSDGRYSNSDELSLFYADALTGPWTPHRNNPVVTDVRRARPAGALFYDGGRLIRPSQDCGKAYGYALMFSEVLTLTETEYEERPIGRLDPAAVTGCVGTHTYNRTELFEVVDRTLSATVADRTATL